MNLEILMRELQNNPLVNILRNIKHNNKSYYPYIPTYTARLELILKKIIADNKNLSKKSFIDIGCGFPAIPIIMDILGCKQNKGLEYSELYIQLLANQYKKYMIQGDLLTYDFKDFDILYSYNPIEDPELMIEGIKNITKTMKKGAIFYFNCVSGNTNILKDLGFINDTRIGISIFKK